jgi:hypothetical protein
MLISVNVYVSDFEDGCDLCNRCSYIADENVWFCTLFRVILESRENEDDELIYKCDQCLNAKEEKE